MINVNKFKLSDIMRLNKNRKKKKVYAKGRKHDKKHIIYR